MNKMILKAVADVVYDTGVPLDAALDRLRTLYDQIIETSSFPRGVNLMHWNLRLCGFSDWVWDRLTHELGRCRCGDDLECEICVGTGIIVDPLKVREMMQVPARNVRKAIRRYGVEVIALFQSAKLKLKDENLSRDTFFASKIAPTLFQRLRSLRTNWPFDTLNDVYEAMIDIGKCRLFEVQDRAKSDNARGVRL